MGVAPGGAIDGLVYHGGLQLASGHPGFGGLSGLSFASDTRLVMVTDEGHFVSGDLVLDGERPTALANVEIDAILNSSGQPLPRKFARDSESIDVVFRNGRPDAVRVGFENLTRVAEFSLVDGRPEGPATEIAIPDWLSRLRTNETIESLCMAPPASPVAGSTLLITEGHSLEPGSWAATLLGVRDRGDLHLAQQGRVNPTDCAFLANGDLLVVERSFMFLTFTVQIRLIPAEEVRPGATMTGEVILRASGGDVDNFEGIATRILPDGSERITIVSDDNFLGLQRTLLLEFSLPQDEADR